MFCRSEILSWLHCFLFGQTEEFKLINVDIKKINKMINLFNQGIDTIWQGVYNENQKELKILSRILNNLNLE